MDEAAALRIARGLLFPRQYQLLARWVPEASVDGAIEGVQAGSLTLTRTWFRVAACARGGQHPDIDTIEQLQETVQRMVDDLRQPIVQQALATVAGLLRTCADATRAHSPAPSLTGGATPA